MRTIALAAEALLQNQGDNEFLQNSDPILIRGLRITIAGCVKSPCSAEAFVNVWIAGGTPIFGSDSYQQFSGPPPAWNDWTNFQHPNPLGLPVNLGGALPGCLFTTILKESGTTSPWTFSKASEIDYGAGIFVAPTNFIVLHYDVQAPVLGGSTAIPVDLEIGAVLMYDPV